MDGTGLSQTTSQQLTTVFHVSGRDQLPMSEPAAFENLHQQEAGAGAGAGYQSRQ